MQKNSWSFCLFWGDYSYTIFIIATTNKNNSDDNNKNNIKSDNNTNDCFYNNINDNDNTKKVMLKIENEKVINFLLPKFL